MIMANLDVDEDMYYIWKAWANLRDVDGRLPLFTASARSLKWIHTERIFNAYMPVIHKIDGLSGLPLFMLAAAGPASDIESVYNLLKEYPAAISLTRHTRTSENFTDSTIRSGGC